MRELSTHLECVNFSEIRNLSLPVYVELLMAVVDYETTQLDII